jgi:hypothetical protein
MKLSVLEQKNTGSDAFETSGSLDSARAEGLFSAPFPMKTRLWSLGVALLLASGAAHAQTPPAAQEAAGPEVRLASPPQESATSGTKPDPSARIVAYMTAGLGVAGIGVGATFGVLAISRKIDSNKECDAHNFCSLHGLALQRAGQSDGDIATASLVGGAVLFGTGLMLILSPPRALPGDRGDAARAVRVEITPSSARLVGTF